LCFNQKSRPPFSMSSDVSGGIKSDNNGNFRYCHFLFRKRGENQNRDPSTKTNNPPPGVSVPPPPLRHLLRRFSSTPPRITEIQLNYTVIFFFCLYTWRHVETCRHFKKNKRVLHSIFDESAHVATVQKKKKCLEGTLKSAVSKESVSKRTPLHCLFRVSARGCVLSNAERKRFHPQFQSRFSIRESSFHIQSRFSIRESSFHIPKTAPNADLRQRHDACLHG
jgi:hypothetical protein